jgi:ATP-binding cassette subfamily C protein CydC
VLFSFGLTLGAMGLLVTQIDLVPVKVAMALFLPLVGFEASTAFFPNLFIGGRLRSAMKKVQEQQGSVNTAAVLTVNTCNELQVVDVQAMWDQPFTRPLSFTANKSDVVEIRGRSGCGKSTFAQSLLGLTHYQGEFLVDGVPLVHEGSRHLLVSGSLQRAHIFNTSLRENLKIAAPEASDELLQRIIDDLELATFSLDDVIGSYGRAISGGEAKRISVARALLSTTPIVVLDEPLEHLGRDLAMRVAQAITRYTEDRILIVITHTPWPKSTHTVEIHRQ